MRLVPITHIKENSKLALSVVNADGTLLLAPGQVLTEKKISRLKEIGISYVYIIDDYCFRTFSDTHETDMQVVNENILRLKSLSERISEDTSNYSDLMTLQAICQEIISHALQLDEDFKIQYEPVKIAANFIQERAFHVAMMSVSLGVKLGFSEEKLFHLCMAALLKDLSLLSPKFRNIPEPLQRVHPELTCRYLKTYYELDEEILDAILHHHEAFDGTGYPNHLKGDEISELARILYIVDSYYEIKSSHDMLYSTQGVFEVKLKKIFAQFDEQLLASFMSHVDVFTLDTMVRLNNGDVAVVTKNNTRQPFKPTVKIIQSDAYEYGITIGLEAYPNLYIKTLEYYI